MTVFVFCMLCVDFVGEKVYLSLFLLWNCIFYLFIGIIKVYVRKLFKLKNDGKKEYETNPNPL